MRIAVISDTHLEYPTDAFKAIFDEHLASADMLLHCGDITGYEVWRYLESNHPDFYAVLGNCDAVGPLAGRVPSMRCLSAGGTDDAMLIGMIHGFGPRSQVHMAALETFGPDCGLICFGHTHAPYWERHGSTWLLNPGSLSPDNGGKSSLAMVEVFPGQEPTARHIYI